MSSAKSEVETSNDVAPAPAQALPETVERAPEPRFGVALGPENYVGLPPPRGDPSAARASAVMRRPGSSVGRARLARGLQRAIGNARAARMVQRESGTRRIQPKLAVGRPDDPYEREADRMAEIVSRQPAPMLQRKGACSSCEGEKQLLAAPRLLQAAGGADPEVEDASLESRIRSPGGGRPLPGNMAESMGRHFDADFSGVRVHDSAQDRADADGLGAKAFTYGRDIFLGSGGSASDARLMGHELTHVVQQGGADGVRASPYGGTSTTAPAVQRFVTCESGDQCPSRVPGELARSRGPMFVGGVSGPHRGLLVANFSVGRGDLKRDLQNHPTWANFWGQMVVNPHIRWEVLGFSDCQGDDSRNELLRWERAIAVNNALPQQARDQVNRFAAAPQADCMAPNGDEQGRMHNRSALIRQTTTEYSFPEHTVARTLPTGAFLDLQIACVIDGGGCANPASIPALDRRCRTDTAYAGLAVTLPDLVCGTPGLGVAESLERAYPGWRGRIPPCPCTLADAVAAPNFSYDLGPVFTNYHPGAEACYRSDPVATAPGTGHRQQCCYDASGALMIGTSGDGTPDVWAAFGRHRRIDVRSHDQLGFRTYNRYWIPDPGVSCRPRGGESQR